MKSPATRGRRAGNVTASAWLGSFLVAACSDASKPEATQPAPRPELVVYAASSTRDALLALEAPYETEHSVELRFDFAASGDLAKRIVAGRKADVFLSADEVALDEVEAAKLVVPGTRRVVLSNQLVVIEPTATPSVFTTPFEPAQLADDAVKRLSLGHTESVAAGRYAKAWLERVGVWDAVAKRVLPGVDTRAALAAVEAGGAQAGVVFRTDAAHSTDVRVVFAVPLEDGPEIRYPLAVLAGRPHEAAAREFADFLRSPAARAAFESCGFVPIGE
ncbi:MAG: molybdate ABC transporter substrate-binding protein [Planctomycetes bacterium]|nr:molybdate ABC transporter substrate-binding protein [Planctomycetota bacterium]